MANNLIPELRFSEFEEEWKKVPLGEKCNHISYGLTVRPKYVKEGIPLISAREIISGIVNINKAPKISIDDYNALSNKAKPKKGDVFLSKTGSIGFSAQHKENTQIAITQNIAVIRFDNSDLYSAEYLLQYFKTKNFQKSAISKVNQSTIMDLQLGDIRKLKIPFPSYLEQTKIATFLTAVDKRINLLQKKKAELGQYKKSLMQKLFSVKTDGNPSLRFKKEDGSDFEDWGEKRYSDIYTFYSTNSLSRDKLNYKSGITKNIHYGDIHTKFSTLFDIERESVPFINVDVNLNRIKDDNYLKKGDLLIADASEDYDDIGKTVEVVNLNEEKVISGLHTFHARPNKFKMAIGFSGYLLQNWYIRKQVMKIAQGTKVLSISTGRLGEIKLTIPSFEEQQKITGFLSSIDTSIENITKQIDDSVVFKKGLLQKMFI